jgi:hypothetical protein
MADPAKSGGVPVDLLIHDFDQMNWLLGTPRSVFARAPHPDHVLAIVEYDDAKGIAEGSMAMPKTYPFSSNVRVLAEGGVAEYAFSAAPAEDGGNVGASDAPRGLQLYLRSGAEPVWCQSPADPWGPEIAYFVDCVEQGRAPGRGTGAQARAALASPSPRRAHSSGRQKPFRKAFISRDGAGTVGFVIVVSLRHKRDAREPSVSKSGHFRAVPGTVTASSRPSDVTAQAAVFASARAAGLGLDLVLRGRGGRQLRRRQLEHVVRLFAATVTAVREAEVRHDLSFDLVVAELAENRRGFFEERDCRGVVAVVADRERKVVQRQRDGPLIAERSKDLQCGAVLRCCFRVRTAAAKLHTLGIPP